MEFVRMEGDIFFAFRGHDRQPRGIEEDNSIGRRTV